MSAVKDFAIGSGSTAMLMLTSCCLDPNTLFPREDREGPGGGEGGGDLRNLGQAPSPEHVFYAKARRAA